MAAEETLIWTSLILFIALLAIAVYIYFEAYKFNVKHFSEIERIRKLKCRNFINFFNQIYKEDNAKKPVLPSRRNLYLLTQKGSSAHLWFDYPLMAKEFLIGAAFWIFLLGYAIIQVCLIMYFEITYFNTYYSSYATFSWCFCCFEIYKYLSQYNTILKNIDTNSMLIRAGRLEEL